MTTLTRKTYLTWSLLAFGLYLLTPALLRAQGCPQGASCLGFQFQEDSNELRLTVPGEIQGNILVPGRAYSVPNMATSVTIESQTNTATHWDAALSPVAPLPVVLQPPQATTSNGQQVNLDLFQPLYWFGGAPTWHPYSGPVVIPTTIPASGLPSLGIGVQAISLDPTHPDSFVLSGATNVLPHKMLGASPTQNDGFYGVPDGITFCGTTFDGVYLERSGVSFRNATGPPLSIGGANIGQLDPLRADPTIALWFYGSGPFLPYVSGSLARATYDPVTDLVTVTADILEYDLGAYILGTVSATIDRTTGATTITVPSLLPCLFATTSPCYSTRIGMTCGSNLGATDPGPQGLVSGTAASSTDATYFDFLETDNFVGTISFPNGDPSSWVIQ